MSFLRKIKTGVRDIQEISKGLEKLGVDQTKAKAFLGVGNAHPPPPADTGPTSDLKTPSTSVVEAPASTSIAQDAPKKLPLAAKKSIRDEFETKREALTIRLSEATGVSWTIYVDAPSIYFYAVDKDYCRENPGKILNDYFDAGGVQHIEQFVSRLGDAGRDQLNRVAFTHTLTLEPTSDSSIMDCACRIIEGKLCIVFYQSELGANAHTACQKIAEVVSISAAHMHAGDGPRSSLTLSLAARSSISQDWEVQGAALQDQARLILQTSTLAFRPNFEANFAKLRAYDTTGMHSDAQWENSLGATTYEYFAGLVNHIKEKGFQADDLLQDGFKEAVDKNEVELRVVDGFDDKQRTSDCRIEGGKLYIEVVPGSWKNSPQSATAKLIDRL